MNLKQSWVALFVLFLVNFLFIWGGKFVIPLTNLAELDAVTLLKVSFAVILLIFVYAFKLNKACGLSLKINWKTLYIYWPIGLVTLLVIAGIFNQPATLLVKILFLASAVGIAEELMFRGLVFHWFKKLSPIKLILISAFSFGAIHIFGLLSDSISSSIIFAQIYFASGFGIIFAVARIKDHSIMLPIIVHSLFDFIAIGARGGISETFSSADNAQVITGLLIGGTLAWFWNLYLLKKLMAEDNIDWQN